MRIAIRGYQGKHCVLQELLEITESELEELLPNLAENHARMLTESPHMIEIEFLDEPNPLERFFRFGTDPTGMVQPIAVHLDEEEK